MLRSKVTCWFCQKDSQVFVLNRNSWTCQFCEQYNGFKTDGDYNKVIPEMSREVHGKKYCLSQLDNRNHEKSKHSILCDRCNENQEMKLNELKKFEANMNDKSDEEYELFKKKLDYVYDLCRPCKAKLNSHLRQIDSQIGDSLLRQRQSTSSNRLAIGPNKKDDKIDKSTAASNINQLSTAGLRGLNDFCNNFKSTFKKAYTIAGSSVPRKNLETSRNLIWEPSSKATTKKKTRSITCSSLTIVLEDFFIYLCLLLIFSCDLVNLLNDSGVLMNNTNTNNEWFQTLLGLYKQAVFIIVIMIGCSVHLAFKRPKMSRYLISLGFFFNFLVHVNFFDFSHEEQFITEVLLSFFLVSYLSIARVYNLFQLIRYVGLV